ncbi:MAG: hypothetical protein CK424_02495 [Legionella sp.]|nr:MAG: hypothetical protein CK424_02495 [Legionella sp.]
MPSQRLERLSAQIENETTDSFGKFYLYASLLNVLTVRTKSFSDTLPKTTGVLSPNINIGGTSRVANHADSYAREFKKTPPGLHYFIQEIILSFMRQGKLSDLFFIIGKMNEHLKMNTLQQNRSLHSNISFGVRQTEIVNLLKNVQQMAECTQYSIDNSVYMFAAMVGLIVIPLLVSALISAWMAILATVTTGYMIYFFSKKIQSAAEQMKDAVERYDATMDDLVREQTININTPNNLSYFIHSIVMPISHLGITMLEQTVLRGQNTTKRKDLCTLFKEVDECSKLTSVQAIETRFSSFGIHK